MTEVPGEATDYLATVKLVLIDSHIMFREGLVELLKGEPDMSVTGQASSWTEGLRLPAMSNAAMVLLGINGENEYSREVCAFLRDAEFRGRVIVLNGGRCACSLAHLPFDVAAVVHKREPMQDFFRIIRRVARGETLSGEMKPEIRAAQAPVLNERDKSVIRCVLQGLTNREIGNRLGISEGAAKASLRYVCGKLGVRTRAQVVVTAIQRHGDQFGLSAAG